MKIPNTTWKIRKGKDWFEESASDYFSGKRSLVVSLPGAFTPIWSEMQLPGLEALYDDYKEKGIDEVIVSLLMILLLWMHGQKNMR